MLVDMKVDINIAREICKTVKDNFPYKSPWRQQKISYREIIKNGLCKEQMADVIELQKEISKNRRKVDTIRDDYQFYTEAPFKYFERLISSVKKYQAINCGETARLGYLTARINGIKDSDVTISSLASTPIYTKADNENMLPILDRLFGSLITYEYGIDFSIIDHVVTKLTGKREESYIIDPLLDSFGTIKEMENFYTNKYGDIFNLEKDEKIKITDYPSPPYPILPTITDEEALALGKKFQFLVLEENKDKINSTKKHFIGLLEK